MNIYQKSMGNAQLDIPYICMQIKELTPKIRQDDSLETPVWFTNHIIQYEIYCMVPTN